MPVLMLVICGIAAGFVITRLLRMETDLLTTAALGIFGALAGLVALRLLAGLTGWAAGFAGAALGVAALVLAWRWYQNRR